MFVLLWYCKVYGVWIGVVVNVLESMIVCEVDVVF